MTSILPPSPTDHDADAVFVIQYVQHRDPVRACVEAGLSDTNFPITVYARQVLERPEIKSAIAVLEKVQPAGGPITDVTLDAAVARLLVISEKAEAGGEYNAAINAIKTIGAFKNWLSQNINVNHRMVASDMSDDDLERIASQKNAIDVPFTEVRKGIGHMRKDDEE